MAGIADCLSAIDFSPHRTVALAVSGGSDSIALVVLASEHLKSRVRLVAVTVDHELRPESAGEAETVAALCTKFGLEHVTKKWRGTKPVTGIQAAAREARYNLLSEAATELGTGLVLTGHTSDDQLETLLMRKERGEGPGLAGIAPATLAFRDDGKAPIWFARPFLEVTRKALRQEVMQRGIAWIDDPSNANPDFERVRVRNTLAGLGDGGRSELRELQQVWSHRRHELSGQIGLLIARHISKAAPGLYCISAGIAQEANRKAAIGALQTLMAFAGGSERMIDQDAAVKFLDDLQTGEPFRSTGSGALIDRRKHGLFLLREDRDLKVVMTDFDGRYVVQQNGQPPRQVVFSADAPSSLVTAAQKLEPPQPLQIIRHLLNPWPRRVPLFDLPAASALARLAGELAFPPAPCSL
jgi:tRNA(Ile)-lysidine synthase